mmetsp:Transcript_94897/g.186156  ORF Transcript_94897/g.186156 Transcript_94897/m.186156 type:complete len:168 (-) Transcript_94897:23-526(-)
MGRSRSRSRGGDRSRIQRLVDDRQQARKDRDFDRADMIRDELRGMGVNVDDTSLSWRGPGGMEGAVSGGGGIQRRDGDWDCPQCGKMVFASKDSCFSCGAQKPSSGRGGRCDSRDRGGGGGRTGGSRRGDSRDRGRRGRYEASPPPRRRDDSRGRDRRRGGSGRGYY